MKNDKDLNETNDANDEPSDTAQDASNEAEFKVTVRKLEMPVRPRGVLAE